MPKATARRSTTPNPDAWDDPTSVEALTEPAPPLPPAASGTSAATVYYLHTADHDLLYIGVTSRGLRRLAEHEEDKPWWPQVAYASFEHFPTREAAAIREADAIRILRPPHNRAKPHPTDVRRCERAGCHRKHFARGMCNTHYMAYLRAKKRGHS